jgi:hypothetical protein
MTIRGVAGDSGIPRPLPGARLAPATGVQWLENDRIPDGDIPFSYPVICVAVPGTDTPHPRSDTACSSFTSACGQTAAETREMIARGGNQAENSAFTVLPEDSRAA